MSRTRRNLIIRTCIVIAGSGNDIIPNQARAIINRCGRVVAGLVASVQPRQNPITTANATLIATFPAITFTFWDSLASTHPARHYIAQTIALSSRDHHLRTHHIHRGNRMFRCQRAFGSIARIRIRTSDDPRVLHEPSSTTAAGSLQPMDSYILDKFRHRSQAMGS